MAGLADMHTPRAQQHTPTTATRKTPSRPSLPSGPCNFRDVASGSCGCDQFWDKCSAELHDESTEQSSSRSTWCVCGHHACFHLRESRDHHQPASTVATALQITQSKCNGQCQLRPGAHCDMHNTKRQLGSPGSHTGGQAVHHGRIKTPQSDVHSRPLQQGISQAHASNRTEQGRDAPSQASTSGLPSIPSMCMISHNQHAATDTEARNNLNQSRQTVTGLGLSMMQLESMGTLNRQQSPTPTVADDASVGRAPQQSFSEPELPSTRANSIAPEAYQSVSPSRGAIDQIVEFNRNLQVDIPGDTIPNTYNPADYIHSATEVATPSIANTPDLGVADQAVQEGKALIDTLARLTSNMQQETGSPGRPASATSAPGSQRWLTNSPVAPQEQLQNLLRAASPQALHKLISYLAPLHNLLNSIPNVANTMRDLGNRLDMLENGSFNYVQPEEFNQTLSMYDDRLVDLETRMDEHDKHHQAIEADDSSTASNRRRHNIVNASFDSNRSLQSTTSSALILAAMDRKDTEMDIDTIKDRLDVLEAAALPTAFQPWEVEVVLIPWGRDLRGIWFSPDEPMHDTSRMTTQDSEEWTQARNSRQGQDGRPLQSKDQVTLRDLDSSPQLGPQNLARGPVFSDNESGWSSQAISDWASGSADDWLFPKACGSNNLVYKRLHSRGFIRNITLRSASARELQGTLSHAFGDLLEHLSYSNQDEDVVVAAYPGLKASFIPLRKVHKESKLRFLTPAEMSSSALWTAQFLTSGIMMRVSGGRKRLYVTQREAYIQHSDDLGSTWTWQELRQLPRFQPDKDSQMEGNDAQCQPQVPEADAKETCWQYIEAYDAPPASVTSSFGSHQSLQLSMRPADRQWRRSITPSSILKNKVLQPISPLSEFHPRPAQLRQRTASASVAEQVQAGASKRRFNSSPVKQSSAPQPTSRTPSVSVARLKRRRTANSTSLHQDEDATSEAQVAIWNPTPRRSREPPSPFYSSQPALPRTNSDVTSRPSQRSALMVGKSTPFAYATPHSGPFVGGAGFGGFNNGGDTEPDDDNDADEDDDDDGEQSWPGVTDGDDDASSSASSENDAAGDAQHGASFSGDDSGFGTESGDDDGEQSEFDIDRNPRHNTTDDDEDGDVFDTLLDVLEH
ncbi:hypothetical protein FB567DRAFT_269616 [Paraphoma chrysanthemicola]|uniref:Uncharacterized protein n=1 Tax=Paraphoma chrysanthemicola TaxID=798071 RepID=A0A8K0REA2_9PLEO|nr:hypothetical protein FB567DRAFT_269616 [Paraphoma chrysanthemicola]